MKTARCMGDCLPKANNPLLFSILCLKLFCKGYGLEVDVSLCKLCPVCHRYSHAKQLCYDTTFTIVKFVMVVIIWISVLIYSTFIILTDELACILYIEETHYNDLLIFLADSRKRGGFSIRPYICITCF